MGQMAGGHTQHVPSRPLKAPNGKRQRRAAMAPRVPRLEDEDPRLKCKDCGAFGHNASSTGCPMKRWDGCLAPQAFVPRKPKENVEPRQQQGQHKPGPFNQAARDMEEGQRREAQQRKALLQRFPRIAPGRQQRAWRDATESCDYVRHPHRPMPVYSTKRVSVLEPHVPAEPPSGTPDTTQLSPSAAPLGRPAASTFPPAGRQDAQQVGTPAPPAPPAPAHQRSARDPGLGVQLRQHRPRCASLEASRAVSKARGIGHAQAPAKRPEGSPDPPPTRLAASPQPHIQTPGTRWAPLPDDTCQNPRKKPRCSPFQPPHKSTGSTHVGLRQSLCRPARTSACGPTGAAQLTRKTPASVQSRGLQPPRPQPHLDTLQACPWPLCPPCPQAPGQPLRMVFSRLDKGGWSSRFIAAPCLPPPERPVPPGQGPPITHQSEGGCVPVSLSILHDDLQLSSSSEESDRE
ncbi:putative protein FAM90A23P [Panthera leo]|uniref:putative protein FAM90A23P n=1 Tax=Panthera leo TaxID=9689 RepID=UPI001C6A8442|nr:putative protein FAM90A23P [Panthera leo]XP_042790027.1 putative protein FAM90A23P [Panthera leo]XP_042790028.1 putative protein FAM90A23P [Panthera leo]